MLSKNKAKQSTNYFFVHKNKKVIHLLKILNIKDTQLVFELKAGEKPKLYKISNPNLFNDKIIVHFEEISKTRYDELMEIISPKPTSPELDLPTETIPDEELVFETT